MKNLIIKGVGLFTIGIGFILSIFFIGNLFCDRSICTGIPPNFNFSSRALTIAYLPFAFWFLITGGGILLRREWARYSFIIMCYFFAFLGLVIFITIFLLPSRFSNNFKLIFLIAETLFLIVLPVFFLFFFNQKVVKTVFFVPQEFQLKRPKGLYFIVFVHILGGLFYLFLAFSHQKLPITTDLFLSGIPLIFFLIFIALLNFYFALGLLRLKEITWVICVFYHTLNIMITTLQILTLPDRALLEAMPLILGDSPQAFLFSTRVLYLLSLLTSLLVLIYLGFQKRFFFKSK